MRCRSSFHLGLFLVAAVPSLVSAEEIIEGGKAPAPSEPEEDDWGDDGDDEEGFGEASDSAGFVDVPGDQSTDGDEVETSTEKERRWSFGGFARTEWGLWLERFEENPFAKGRQNLDLVLRYKGDILRLVASGHAEYDVAYLYKRDSYDEPTLDAYEWLVDVRESYLAAALDMAEMRIGRQIVVWGEGDMLSLLDVASPKDQREPGLADLDDLRLPVLSTRISLFVGYHRIEALIVHESSFGYRSPPLGPFSPLPAFLAREIEEFLSTTPIWYEDKQDRFELENQQALMRWSYKGPGIDLALYLASVLDQQGVIELNYQQLLRGVVVARRADIVVDHPRYLMVGHSGAWPFGGWLFKWELKADFDRSYNIGDETAAQPDIGVDKASALGGMVGVTYSGFRDTRLFIEFKKSWLLDDVPDLLFPAEEPAIAMRYTHNVLREDLTLELAATIFGWSANYGWLARATVEYIITDGLKIGAGYITYQPGAEFGLLSGADRHDRFSVKLRWDFTLY